MGKDNSNPRQDISNDERSTLHDLIERTNTKLELFYQSIMCAKSSTYENEKINFFSEEILNKYSTSVIQIDKTSLSMERSIWLYANDLIDLSEYEKELAAYAITNSHVEFNIVIADFKDKIYDDVLDFVSDAFVSINKAMKNYEFYIVDSVIKNFEFNDSDDSLNVQFKITVDVK